MGDEAGHSTLCRDTVTFESISNALAPASPASFRCTRNGPFWPSMSSSVISIGGFEATRRQPSGMLRIDGGPSSGARYTATRAPPGVSVTQPHMAPAIRSRHHRDVRVLCGEHLFDDTPACCEHLTDLRGILTASFREVWPASSATSDD